MDLLKTSCYVIYPSIPAVPFYPLYQYKEEDTPMSWLTSPESMWVAMVYPTQLRGNLTRLFFQSAKRANPFRGKVTLKSSAATTYMTTSSRCPHRYSGHRSRPAQTLGSRHTFRTCPVLNTSQVVSVLQQRMVHTRWQYFISNGRQCNLARQGAPEQIDLCKR